MMLGSLCVEVRARVPDDHCRLPNDADMRTGQSMRDPLRGEAKARDRQNDTRVLAACTSFTCVLAPSATSSSLRTTPTAISQPLRAAAGADLIRLCAASARDSLRADGCARANPQRSHFRHPSREAVSRLLPSGGAG